MENGINGLGLNRKLICASLTLSIFVAGCGGHMANPVDRYMLGDEKKSCNAIYAEMSQLDQDVTLKRKEITNKDRWNVIYLVTGFLIIVPWFFMDIKGSHKVELDAFRARKKALAILFAEKDCSAPSGAAVTN